MQYADSHLSDEQLLLDIDGELAGSDVKNVRSHLDACWRCRTRRQELDGAIGNFVRSYQHDLDANIPSSTGPRALLKAQLEQLSQTAPGVTARCLSFLRYELPKSATAGVVAAGLLLLGLFFSKTTLLRPSAHHDLMLSMPDPRLTPGAAYLMSRRAVCDSENTKNKAVPAVIQKKVFEEYGISGAKPQAYEVDYLVTPALGGTDDLRNLWPHSFSATWNAKVKDELEDRLRDMVCDGSIDVSEAQHEISENWIAAYKKYFHTDKPVGRP